MSKKTRAQVQAFIDAWKALEKETGLELSGWCCYGPQVQDQETGTELWSEEFGFEEQNLDG